MNWRKWNKIIHRDLGYLCFGLTIIYAVSGIAVNHIDIWNPSYRIEHIRTKLDGPVAFETIDRKFISDLLERVGEGRPLKNVFRPAPQTVQIFVEGNTLTLDLKTGELLQEKVSPRPVLRQLNFLHLNHPKKLWSWFADIYGLALCALAISGLFMLSGKRGITGRGAWLTSVGILLPLAFLWLYYS